MSAVSLNGNLEDLPLLDIIQIVSFSKKTGFLTIHNTLGEAAIVFDDGAIVATFTWDSLPLDPRAQGLPGPAKAKLLRNRIEASLEQLIRLREGQFSFSLTDEVPTAVGPRDLSAEMLHPGINAQEVLIDLARGMDEDRRDSTAAVEAGFATPDPDVDPHMSFADVLPPEAPRAAASAATAPAPPRPEPEAEREPEPIDDVASFIPDEPEIPPAPASSTVPDDLDLEELVEEPAEPSPAPPAKPALEAVGEITAPAKKPPRALPTILLVDDEDDVRKILAEHFAKAGYTVVEAEDPDVAVKKANQLGKGGLEYLLITDLGMPTSGGASFQGGFEVVKRIWKMNMRPQVLLMTESLSGTLQARARQMGVTQFVFKPGLSKLDPEQFEADMRAFARKILTDVLPPMLRSAGTSKSTSSAARKPSRPALASGGGASAEELSRQLALLQVHLEELRATTEASQVSLLVMKVAREFFERGVLFLVKGEMLRGLGGFGLSPRGESLNLLVREVQIPLNEESIFLDAVAEGRSQSGPWPDGKWESHLLGAIGRFQSSSLVLLPLQAHRETIAVLFGDNPQSGREPPRLDALELFINQAGIALENAFLQRKLESMRQGGSDDE